MSDCLSQYVRQASLGLAIMLLALPAAWAQMPGDLVEEALDQPVSNLEIQDTPLRDALAQIEKQTGLRFVLDDSVLELMPYGERTRVSVRIADTSVRAGLQGVLDGLGLEMFVEEGDVVIFPAPVLQRVGRRLTIEEIGILTRLASEKWAATQAGPQMVPVEFRFDPTDKPQERLTQAIAQVAGDNALHQLESACEALDWIWRPEGKRIVFERWRDEISRRLDIPLNLTYQREPLDRLLVDLGTRIGVLMKFEPGVLAKVSASERQVDLIQHNVSVRQVLERICGSTGMRYQVDDEGVMIRGPQDAGAGPTAANIQQWVRIEVEIRPGVTMDVFVRQDQLPKELREEAQRKLDAILRGGE